MTDLTNSTIQPTNNTSSSYSASYYYCYTSPLAFTVLLILFFALSFAVVARLFFSGVHSADIDDHPLTQNWRLGYYSRPVRTVGLDHSVVRMLPIVTYSSVVVGGIREGCVVCLSEFEEKEKVKLIPRCGHMFHPGCIDGWLVLHGSCPICRCSDVSVDSTSSGHEEGEEGREEGRKVVELGSRD